MICILKTVKMRTKDRRFIKTEKVIQSAMISLLNEMNPETLQIEDLTNEADINKSTFYLHYQSIDLLVSALEDTVISGLTMAIEGLEPNYSRFDFFQAVLIYISQNQKLVKAVFNASTYRFNVKIENFCEPFLMPAPTLKRKHLVSHIALLESSLIQSCVAYLRVWTFDGCHYSTDEVVQDLIQISSAEPYRNLIIR